MERDENKGWQGEEKASTCLHRMSQEENPLLRREASLQTLSEESDTMCLQGYYQEGSPENGLHGHVGQETEAHGRSRGQADPEGKPAIRSECGKVGR